MADTKQRTRYQRVIEILDTAAAGGATDYDGKGLFWHLPLPKLLDVEIYGVRMIAPVETAAASCCHHVETTQSRGARSGLIIGLRGQSPFDGTHYPRLPWGGQPVTDSDISFISEWIDAGCPADDHQTTFPVQITGTAAKETIQPDNVEPEARCFEVYEGSPNEYTYKYGELKQRMNVDFMSKTEIDKFRWAFRELYRLNKWPEDRRSYNNMALIHQNHCQHGWERFLPWHRVYLYEMEQTLQDVCPGITIPYWDFTMPQYCPEHPENGLIIPPAYQAFLTKESINYLQNEAKPALPEASANALLEQMVDPGLSYPSQATFFAAVEQMTGTDYSKGEYRENFLRALLAANSLWYPLRYPAEYGGGTINTVIQYHYPTAADMNQILSLRTFRDFGGGSFYDDSFGFLDQNPHNTMHIWTGGMNPDYNPNQQALAEVKPVMASQWRNRSVQVAGRRFHSMDDLKSQPKFGDMFSNLTASYDPVFWPIHTNIDRTWHEWQIRNPHSQPADLDSVLTPWSYTIADTLDMSRFGYEYVKCAFLIPVG